MSVALLVDGSNLMHRSYQVQRARGLEGEELSLGAVQEYRARIDRMQRETRAGELMVAMDVGPTFRHRLLPSYKAQRSPNDQALRDAFRIEQEAPRPEIINVAAPGYEADDVIASLARRGIEAEREVHILSNDQDLLALAVFDQVTFHLPQRTSAAEVRRRLGYPPERHPLYKALVGDSSDNLPGIPNVGPKKAAPLVQRYPDAAALWGAYLELPAATSKHLLAAGRHLLELQEHLTTLRQDAHNVARWTDALEALGRSGKVADELAAGRLRGPGPLPTGHPLLRRGSQEAQAQD